MTRRYFTKALPPPTKIRRPSYKGKVAIVRLPSGVMRTMKAGELALQIGRSKGGKALQTSGKAHKWTSEEARAAGKKSWEKKGRLVRGVRVGRRSTKKPAKWVPKLDDIVMIGNFLKGNSND